MSGKMNLVLFYRVVAILGLLVTWYFNAQYFQQGGSVMPVPFFQTAFANVLTTAITIDIYWSAYVFSFWAWIESRRMGMPAPILIIVSCFCLGLAFAFPWFLAQREKIAAQKMT